LTYVKQQSDRSVSNGAIAIDARRPRARIAMRADVLPPLQTFTPIFEPSFVRPVPGRPIAAWLLGCCALVFAMIVVGGATRLTHSGLSIVEWQPIAGALPPLTDAQWQDAFVKYQQTPEFTQVNHAMDIAAFKGIFWWEYFHRLLGRAIGVAFVVPLAWFAARRSLPPRLGLPLATIFALGGLQGAMGWYMVKSGLVDDPHVSHFRLTAHLGLALAILAAMFWIALSLLRPSPRRYPRARGLARASIFVAVLVFVMALTGGLVAGLRAGSAYNTFPLMNGHVVPPEILMLAPWYDNFAYNIATVQFDHRLLAWALAIVVPLFWWRIRSRPALPAGARLGANVLLGALALQVSLGIATLLLHVPVLLGVLHQAGAVLLFTASLNVAQALRQ
jgi:cytochrome c oxidase assembly protein subunit 15